LRWLKVENHRLHLINEENKQVNEDHKVEIYDELFLTANKEEKQT